MKTPAPVPSAAELRVSVAFLRFLLNIKLESGMCFIAAWWGALTLLSSDFWNAWTVTQRFYALTYGHPGAISVVLVMAGLFGFLGMRRNWLRLRVFTSLLAFLAWSLLAVAFLTNVPIATPGVACYTAFAFVELLTFVRNLIDLDSFAEDINALPPTAALKDAGHGIP